MPSVLVAAWWVWGTEAFGMFARAFRQPLGKPLCFRLMVLFLVTIGEII
jgi:hypothetical protein